MGLTKDRMMEDEQRGWSSAENLFICADCAADPDLSELVHSAASWDECSYCGQTGRNLCAPLDVIIERIVSAIELRYQDYDRAGIPWPSDEYGMEHDVYDTYDVLDGLPLDFTDDRILSDIRQSIHDKLWTDVHAYFPTEGERLSLSWEHFSEMVKTSRRYTFLMDEGKLEDLESPFAPARTLGEIVNVAEAAGLTKTLGPDLRVFRARLHAPEEEMNGVHSIGTPRPVHSKRANRMSPAGIPMFYGGSDEMTCLQEVLPKATDVSPELVTFGEFRPSGPIRILDLSRIPEPPGLFSEKNWMIDPLNFLRKFAASVSQKIEDDVLE